MPYNPSMTPDAPLPISMLPDAAELTPADLLLLTQLGNTTSRSRRLSLDNLLKSRLVTDRIGHYYSEAPESGEWRVDLTHAQDVALVNLKMNFNHAVNEVYLDFNTTRRLLVIVHVDYVGDYEGSLSVRVGAGPIELSSKHREFLHMVVWDGRPMAYNITGQRYNKADTFTADISISTPSIGGLSGDSKWGADTNGFMFEKGGSTLQAKVNSGAGGWVLQGLAMLSTQGLTLDPSKFESVTSSYNRLTQYASAASWQPGKVSVLMNSTDSPVTIQFFPPGATAIASPLSVSIPAGKSVLAICTGQFLFLDHYYGNHTIIGG